MDQVVRGAVDGGDVVEGKGGDPRAVLPAQEPVAAQDGLFHVLEVDAPAEEEAGRVGGHADAGAGLTLSAGVACLYGYILDPYFSELGRRVDDGDPVAVLSQGQRRAEPAEPGADDEDVLGHDGMLGKGCCSARLWLNRNGERDSRQIIYSSIGSYPSESVY